jgi:polyphenol oxidase
VTLHFGGSSCYTNIDVRKPDQLRSVALELAGFVHAFFTRHAGDARIPLHFDEAALALRVEPRLLYVLSQVHGNDVRVIGTADDSALLRLEPGDALVAKTPGHACAVRVADCVPVLIADRTSGAVAAVHSGWRGTVSNVAEAAVARLRGVLEGPGDLVAAIGPHIEACCFEVGPDVAERLEAAPGGRGSVDVRAQRPHVNLRQVVRAQLEAVDVAVDDVRGCTVCDRDRFFSHRREQGESGRMLAAIAVRTR